MIICIPNQTDSPQKCEHWVPTAEVMLKNRRGPIIGTTEIAHDVSDRKKAEAQITYLALHEALTGLQKPHPSAGWGRQP